MKKITSRVIWGGVILIWVVAIILLLSPVLFKNLFFQIPEPAANFDCDDSTQLMYDRLSSVGIIATPVLGNVKVTGESYSESDHIWLLVNFLGRPIALDWGVPRFEKQYYEGYSVSYADLLFFVEQDRISATNQIPASPAP